MNKGNPRHSAIVHKEKLLRGQHLAWHIEASNHRRIIVAIVNRIHYLISKYQFHAPVNPCHFERQVRFAKSQGKKKHRSIVIFGLRWNKESEPGFSIQRANSTMGCSPDWGWLLTEEAAVAWRLPECWVDIDASWMLILCARFALH